MGELNRIYSAKEDVVDSIEELADLEHEDDNISKMIEVATEQEYTDEINTSDLLHELRKITVDINSHLDTYNYKNIDSYRKTIKLAIGLRKRASKDKKYDAYIKAINKSLGKLISLNKTNPDI